MRDHRYSAAGASVSMLANRISHVFDLRGPSVAVETACSSSMYAVHLAVSAIRNGDCDSALVAASNWIADPGLQIALDKFGALSPTSRCHTFDVSADGYARGEGFAALYLKRLPGVVTDGSPIRAVIRGTAVNANGRTAGISRPSAAGQEAIIRKAYDNARLPFSDTTYLECHGTGTPAGDLIELEAASKVFTSNENSGAGIPKHLFVGSVKTNMGHAEGASAVASIMKVVLSLEAGEIPPNVGVKMLNPNIDFTNARVEVVRERLQLSLKIDLGGLVLTHLALEGPMVTALLTTSVS
ncbi:thiolase-like protein [Annulohypoxylon truncatum]|uniref:thiolase-like protein n=1 Tax=Annulohypoxylon truncatum TaxID=327061 RepID=UPI0020086EFC|nr:thiolase-like protein [Annulohypoxylon truncatum]KAI1211541.1 thiolase-like protein [Annulohypoxylon truncatum]